LLNERTAHKNKLEASSHEVYPNRGTIKRLNHMIAVINENIEEVERDIQHILSNNRTLKKKVDKVATINGVGVMTVVTVVAETNGFNLFRNKKQLVSYVGYDVQHKESGKTVHK
ncbi:MAG: transposase, partial [Flavobacteriales bacterium]